MLELINKKLKHVFYNQSSMKSEMCQLNIAKTHEHSFITVSL